MGRELHQNMRMMMGGIRVKVFTTKNGSQLGKCLRLLHSDGFSDPFDVKVKENEKQKIFYELHLDVDDKKYDELMEKYRLMIS